MKISSLSNNENLAKPDANNTDLFNLLYKQELGATVYMLHRGLIYKGELHTKRILIVESRNDKNIPKINRSIKVCVKTVGNPAENGPTFIEVDNEPIALTKEDLVKLISLD